MASYSKFILAIIFLTGVTACSPDTETQTKNSEMLTEDMPEETFTEMDTASTDDNCGSLKPLLKLLPQASSMNGLPETYRGCDNSSEQSVSVVYNDEGDDYSEIQFKIYVLDSESEYAKSNLVVEGATEKQQAFINKTFKFTGDMHKTILDTCRRYHAEPMIPDGRNPLIVQVKNQDVCIMDNLDANKEIWNAFAIKNELEFRVELQGKKAADIATTDLARDQLIPIFSQFDFM
jgi:hypothetical protein